jgi:hypothetical protein
MKRVALLVLLLFLPVIFVQFFVLPVFSGIYQEYNKIAAIVENGTTAPHVLLGDSVAAQLASSGDPKIQSVANLGIGGSLQPDWYYLARRILAWKEKPKSVVLVSTLAFYDVPITVSPYQYRILTEREIFQEKIPMIRDLLIERFFPVLVSGPELKQRLLAYLVPNGRKLEDVIRSAATSRIADGNASAEHPRLLATRDILRDAGIKFTLVLSPLSSHERERAKFAKGLFLAYARKHEISVVDLNSMLPDSDLPDGLHPTPEKLPLLAREVSRYL